jgi:protein-tyrosine phosphatase
MSEPPNIVLFLCTGNYFRSRFSEELFNHWARRMQLDWRAESRGLMPDMEALKRQNVGRISRHALDALEVRGIQPRGAERWPMPVQRDELEFARRTIALKEAEHRPMMTLRFPDLVDRIEYWAVDDIDVLPPPRCIEQAEAQLLKLLQELRESD